ncbi:MAG: UPF0104 family protein, partial [Gammaproteobacteria bacterium]|nr:UPF0104 family protein [Gammaproteobacteria bacterium]
RPPICTIDRSPAASDGYKRLIITIALIALAMLVSPRVLLAQRRAIQGLNSKLANTYRHVLGMLLHTNKILKPMPLVSGLGLGVVAWFLDGAGFYFITQHFVPGIEITTVVGIYAVSILLGAFSFMPGGVGATEALMYGFLHLLGIQPEDAVVIIILSRLTTIWFAVSLGAVSVMLLGKRDAATASPA